MPKILKAVTAFPENYYTQDELILAFREAWSSHYFNIDRLEQFHKNVLVGGRHLALKLEQYDQLGGFGQSNDHWITSATNLAEKTLLQLFDSILESPYPIHALASTTITGIAVPSLDARIMNRLDFPAALKRMPLFGLGCLGGAAGLSRISDYLAGHPDDLAVLLSVELCSLTMQKEDLSVANIVSSGLFGDGAAAVLVAGDSHALAGQSGPSIVANESCFFPGTERVMGWDMVDTGFKIVLDSSVPDFARENLRPALDSFLDKNDLSLGDIGIWVAHPGGPRVITAMEEGLGLETGTLDSSRESLKKYGNLSSTSVLNILDETLRHHNPKPGTYGILLAMGPGFCAEFLLLKW